MIQSRFVQSAGKIFEKPSQLIGKFFFVERICGENRGVAARTRGKQTDSF